MNRRDFIKTGLAFCGCIYLGVDLTTKRPITIEYPISGDWSVIINANGHSVSDLHKYLYSLPGDDPQITTAFKAL